MALTLTDRAFAPLKTERLLLRPLRPTDAEALHRLVNDWAVVRNLTRLPFPYPRDLAGEWIASTARQIEAGTAYHLAITGQEDDSELVGCIGLRLDITPRVGNLGYWVGRRFWGHGVASEAAARLSRWALANLDLDRLEAHAAADNPASAAVLRRAGFREAGQGEAAFLARGGKHPVLHFEATRDDLFPPAETEATPPAPADGKPLVLVSACGLIDADGRVLLARRPEGKPMAGLWEFPGGKVGPGETPEAALIRELQARNWASTSPRACLAAVRLRFASPMSTFHLLMPLYLCRRWSRPAGGAAKARPLRGLRPAAWPTTPCPPLTSR